nr:MAG TPA: hypothetical protein [Caudoviricetes sp.]
MSETLGQARVNGSLEPAPRGLYGLTASGLNESRRRSCSSFFTTCCSGAPWRSLSSSLYSRSCSG